MPGNDFVLVKLVSFLIYNLWDHLPGMGLYFIQILLLTLKKHCFIEQTMYKCEIFWGISM